MREIKFRAWDNVVKEMVYCDNKHYWAFFNSPDSIGYGLYYRNDGHRVLSGEYNPQIMQYTGRKDKNGKEIYESDICSTYNIDEHSNIIDTVVFDNGSFVFQNPHKLSAELSGFKSDYIEVIGNIYQNPELLK